MQTIIFVQQWAQTLACASELPLPLPVRADASDNGVTLSLIAVTAGATTSVGALDISIEPAEFAEGSLEGSDFVLRVVRVGGSSKGALPGEGRLVKMLRDALERRGTVAGYESYHLRR